MHVRRGAIAGLAVALILVALYLVGDGERDAAPAPARTTAPLQLRRVVRAPMMRDVAGAEVDWWAGFDGGSRQDYYLRAPTRDALVARFASLTLPAGTRAAYQLVEGMRGEAAYWRSYILDDEAAVDDRSIADAVAQTDDASGRWQVLATLDAGGARALAELTTQATNEKIAIEYDGRVMSAPVVTQPITGGRFAITVGGDDPRAGEREARAIAQALSRGGASRADGVTARGLLIRIAAGLAAGLVVGGLAWRRMRRSTSTSAPRTRRAPTPS